jgi:hypothetical protein
MTGKGLGHSLGGVGAGFLYGMASVTESCTTAESEAKYESKNSKYLELEQRREQTTTNSCFKPALRDQCDT